METEHNTNPQIHNRIFMPRTLEHAARTAKKYSPKNNTDEGSFPIHTGSIRGYFAKYAAIHNISFVKDANTVPKNPALAGISGTIKTDSHAKTKQICAGNTPRHDAIIFPKPTEPNTL